MAKEVGKIRESAKDIAKIERYVDFSIRGNSNQIPSSDPDLNKMVNDYSVYLNDKEFLEKWYDKKKFTGMHTEEEFDEFGTMEEFGVNEEYYITFKDGSEIHVVFKLPDGDFMYADSREAEKGTMAEKYIREFEMDAWDIDIDSLAKEVGNVDLGKGGLTQKKARQILHEGVAHGNPLTEKQRKFFGARASGYPEKKGKGGKMTGNLTGRKITKVSYPEQFGHVWGNTPMAIHLDNGAMLVPASDYEQNDAGSWFMGDKTFGVIRGGESKEQIKKLVDDASKHLVGKKIIEVDNLTDEELKELGWYNRSVIIILNDGSALFVSKDDEGNDAGALFLVKGEDWIAITTEIKKMSKGGKVGYEISFSDPSEFEQIVDAMDNISGKLKYGYGSDEDGDVLKITVMGDDDLKIAEKELKGFKRKGMEKGGEANSDSSFANYYANHGAVITGGSYFNTEQKSVGGFIIGLGLGSLGGYMYRDAISSVKEKAKHKVISGVSSLEKGGKVKKGEYKFYNGDVVWDRGNKSYGVVLNNFDDPSNGDRGDVRLDSDGMQPIHKYDKSYENIIGYNLVPYGSKEDEGDGDLSELKASAKRLIESNKEWSTERYKEYSLIYCRLLSGEFDKKKSSGGSIYKNKYGQKKVNMTKRGHSIDSKVKAKPAGWRKSKETGDWYFENRSNRSDRSPKHKK